MAIVDGKIECSHCEVWLPLSSFTKKPVKLGHGDCKKCAAAKRKTAYEADPEKKRAYMREWYARRKSLNPAVHEQKITEQYQKSQKYFCIETRRKAALKKYGITPDQYREMLEAQGGGCAICKATENKNARSLFVDHCHATGRVRGILCYKCNTGLGSFSDSPDLIKKALTYLSVGEK